MTFHPTSINGLADQLREEFDGRLPASVVTELAVRLSGNGAVSLPVLAHIMRHELESLAARAGTP